MRRLSCAQFVALVTDYLEGALDPEDERRFVAHAELCPGCETYLDQIRETVEAVGQLTPEMLDPVARDRLLEAFRDWSHQSPGDV